MKQVVVHFEFPNVSAQQYDNVWKDLRASGNNRPKGLIFHVGAPTPNGGWFVTDVWESEEDFKTFGKTLMPIIAKQDIPSVQPIIMPARYVYEGHLTGAV
jgi:hypothetical protein